MLRELKLVGIDGEGKDLKKNNLKEVLEAATSTLHLVFLNACLTRELAQELATIKIPVVIATKVEINDSLAVTFSETFYQALVAGKSIRIAFNLARTAADSASAALPRRPSFTREKSREVDLPWEIFCRKEEDLEWTLKPQDFIDERLSQGSRAYFQQLSHASSETSSQDQKEELLESLLPPLEAVAQARKESSANSFGLGGSDKDKLERTPLTEIIQDQDQFGMLDSVKKMWEHHQTNVIYFGEGGMRKREALLYLWKQVLNLHERVKGQNHAGNLAAYLPIPIYVPLHEYNNATGNERKKFISRFVIRHYLDERSLTPETEKHLWDWLKDPAWNQDASPKVLLLLDGLDDISRDKSHLLHDIRREWAELFYPKKSPIQILMTGRGSSSNDYRWAMPTFELVRLLPHPIILLRRKKMRSRLFASLQMAINSGWVMHPATSINGSEQILSCPGIIRKE
ncbi:MAG: hypothetical protein AAF587_17095 [Bacteroidota bacterium]